MAKKTDIFEVLPEEERLGVMKDTVLAVLGDNVGSRVWKQMEPALRYKRRQLGDHPDPAQNHWKGVWRVYEAE